MSWTIFFPILVLASLLWLFIRFIRMARRFSRRHDEYSEQAQARMQTFMTAAQENNPPPTGAAGSGSPDGTSSADQTRKQPAAASKDRLAAELGILQAMCLEPSASPLRVLCSTRLADYAFADVVHQAVFDALRETGNADPELLREQLPARLTLKGFPDVDCETFLSGTALSPPVAEILISSLLTVG